MEVEIMVLNKMRYEKDGKEKSRLGYIFCGEQGFSNRDKFKGFSELSLYSDDSKYFDNIPDEFIGQKCIAKVSEVLNPFNPMKSKKEFSELTCNGKTVYLV